MSSRSWRWLRVRILGLMTAPVGCDLAGNPIWTTRLQQALAPTPADEKKDGRAER